MKLIFHIAWRYFRKKKSVQAINIISWISVGAIAVSAAAMIILFSVFNGLDHTIKTLYTSFNPEIKISPEKGKFFELSNAQKNQLKAIPGITYLSETIEDMALLSNGANQRPAIVKGVDNVWFHVSGINDYMLYGQADWSVQTKNVPAVLGLGIANNLSINVQNPFSELQIFYPKANVNIGLNPEQSLARMLVKPLGVFHIQQDMDNKYLLLPLQAAQRLFNQSEKLSAIELNVSHPEEIEHIQEEVEKVMGPGFKVANRFQQNQALYMVLSGEKWMVYLILLFVLLIASFNLTGCLYMLVLEKKKDISILRSMGLNRKAIRAIFLWEGGLLAMTGAFVGVILGFMVCLGQIYFAWVGLPSGFVVTAYPVAFEWTDFALVLSTSIVIGLLAAWYPAFKAGRQPVYLREE